MANTRNSDAGRARFRTDEAKCRSAEDRRAALVGVGGVEGVGTSVGLGSVGLT